MTRRAIEAVGRAAVLGVCLTLLAAASAGATIQRGGAKKPPAINVQQNLADLYAKAKAEGTVVWEVGSPTPQYQPLVKAFEAKYPGINVQMINIQGTEVPGRVISEGKNLTMDLLTQNTTEALPLARRKLLRAPRWALYGIPTSEYVLGGRMLHVTDFAIGWFYNTQKLTKSQVPTTWDDLLSSKWSGRAVETNQQGPLGYESMFLSRQWNLAQFKAYANKLHAQGHPTSPSGAAGINDVATGQALMGVSAIVQLPKFIKNGAPLALLPVGPVVAQPDGPSVPLYAHHPYAAMLLAVFLASPDARPIWSQIGQSEIQPCSAGPLAQLVCNAKLSVVYTDTLSKVINYISLENINRKIFGFTVGG